MQVVRRGVTLAHPLVPSQVQAPRDDAAAGEPGAASSSAAGATLQVPQLQRLLQVAQGLHRPPELAPRRRRARGERREQGTGARAGMYHAQR